MLSEQISLILLKSLDFLKMALAPICTLLAGYIGVRYGLKQIRIQRKLDFIERQLREFYSPLLSYHREIRAKGELRVRIGQAAEQCWRELCEKQPEPFLEHDKYFEPYKKIIEYDNKQLKSELLPLYNRMLSTFSDKYWLAEPETQKWYSALLDFVELWNRWITKNIPPEVIEKLSHSEERLNPFYEELEKRFYILREKLSK